MKRAGGLGAVLCRIAVLSAALGASCGDDDATEPGDACARLASVLQECGVLSPGTLKCEGQADELELDSCVTDCVAAAECSTVVAVVCSDEVLTTTDGVRLDECALQCNERFGFHCADPGVGQAVVPPDYVCDAEADCADGSDEVGCEQFDCGDGQQVVLDFFCDGYPDCANERDEGAGCEHFTCPDGTSLPASFRCDSEADCDDGSDEAGCGAIASIQCGA